MASEDQRQATWGRGGRESAGCWLRKGEKKGNGERGEGYSKKDKIMMGLTTYRAGCFERLVGERIMESRVLWLLP